MEVGIEVNSGADHGTIFSIGHSNHSAGKLFDLMRLHRVEVLVDVRSQPSSKYAPHFNRAPLKRALEGNGFKYLFLGHELGGRPDGDEFYDKDGHVLYNRVAQSHSFLDGIERLEKGAAEYRLAIMCSEEDPTDCHRRLLIGRVLTERGTDLIHIRGDGTFQREEDLRTSPTQQESLFDQETSWRSIQSVSQRGTQQISSGR